MSNLKNTTHTQQAVFPDETASRLPHSPLPWVLLGLALAFALPLYRLLGLALDSELYSHIPLIPCVSLWFWWTYRDAVANCDGPPIRWLPVGLAGLGLAALLMPARFLGAGEPPSTEDALVRPMLAFVLFIWATCVWFSSPRTLRTHLFPLGFLILIVPLPSIVQAWIETQLQHASAEAAYLMFRTAGTTLYRDGLVFMLPGITLHVEPQCSGIRSSLVLLITSVVAARLFLRAGWKRILIVLFVIPLAIVRNGFRVFTIGELCVRVGPDMIDSPIHHHGGPLFFALSLIPFFALLFWLYRSENRPSIPSKH